VSAAADTVLRAPDLITPVVAFRQWRLDDGALWSPYAGYRWQPGANTAVCDVPGARHVEPAPGHACTCGLHAWYRPCPRGASAATADLVAGAVVLWGELELHPTGMRARHASVIALALPLWPRRKRLETIGAARRLGVPAVRARELRAVACEHGAPLTCRWAPTPRSAARG
jgi:hypothetical protein